MDVDGVADACREANALDLGRHLACFFPLDLEPRRVQRLAVKPDVRELAVLEVHVEGVTHRHDCRSLMFERRLAMMGTWN
jgi:hypothetical protein